MADYTVSSHEDWNPYGTSTPSIAGSLREAFEQAQDGDTITINTGLPPILLSARLPPITVNLTIIGNGATIDGQGQHRIFFIGDGGSATPTVVLDSLTLTGGFAKGGDGGGAVEDGIVTAGGGGGMGAGAALFVSNGADVRLIDTLIGEMRAKGGGGGYDPWPSNGTLFGGGSGGGGLGGNGGSTNLPHGEHYGTGGGVFAHEDGTSSPTPGVPGVFGRGGGALTPGRAGDGGFGGGGAGAGWEGGNGGFGGGGGGGLFVFDTFYYLPGRGGFGGGDGIHVDSPIPIPTLGGGGGGGAGFGGAIFVQDGGTLRFEGTGSIKDGAVSAGSGATGAPGGGAAGSGIFLQGSGTLSFAPEAGKTISIDDAIADQLGFATASTYTPPSGSWNGNETWGLEKTGNGLLVLAGDNTYAGPTTVAAGRLVVNGSIALSETTIQQDATLGGTGTAGAVIVESGGVLAPGEGPGTIQTGSLTFQTGATLQLEFAGAGGSLSYDQVRVTGTVDLTGAQLELHPSGSFRPAAGQRFTLINNDGIDPILGTFAGYSEGATISMGGYSFKLSYKGGDGNDLVIITPAAPPPPPAVTLEQVKAAHFNVLGLTLADAEARSVVAEIARGSYGFDAYVTTLIDRADMSTLPAVIVSALLTGLTPTQGHLPDLGAFSTLQFEAYRDAGSLNPGLGPYEALGLGFSSTAPFRDGYAALSDPQFLGTAYEDVFGRPATDAQLAHFAAQLASFEGLYQGAGQSAAQAGLHARGAVIGQMIGHAVLDEPELHSFDDAAIAFLRDAAAGRAHYGEPLALI